MAVRKKDDSSSVGKGEKTPAEKQYPSYLRPSVTELAAVTELAVIELAVGEPVEPSKCRRNPPQKRVMTMQVTVIARKNDEAIQIQATQPGLLRASQ